MPRGFTEQEKNRIIQLLMDEGRVLFSRYGLKKTSINELVKEAGIAPGSFYTFFNSKEELYFEIIEKEEELIKAALMNIDMEKAENPKYSMKEILLRIFKTIEENPLISQLFFENNYDALIRKLPPEKIEAHFEKDSDMLGLLMTKWKEIGLIREIDKDVLAGLLRALFTFSLHKKEIGEDVYPQVISLLVDFLVEGLFKGEK